MSVFYGTTESQEGEESLSLSMYIRGADQDRQVCQAAGMKLWENLIAQQYIDSEGQLLS